MTKLRLPLVLIIGVAAISTAALFIRFAQSAGAPSLTIAALRLLISGTILLVLAGIRGLIPEILHLSKREWAECILASLFLGLHFAAWVSSLEFTSILSSAVLVTTTPIWIASLSPLLLHEKTKPLTLVGMGIAIIGGIIITTNGRQPGLSNPSWGNALALFGAFMAAGYFLIGRRVRARIPLLPYLSIIFTLSGFLLLLLAVITEDAPFSFSFGAWKWIILTAFIPQLIGHTLANYSLKRLSASFVSITWLGEPIGATLLAMAFLNESPEQAQILGGIVILGGILISSFAEQPEKEGNDGQDNVF